MSQGGLWGGEERFVDRRISRDRLRGKRKGTRASKAHAPTMISTAGKGDGRQTSTTDRHGLNARSWGEVRVIAIGRAMGTGDLGHEI